MKINEGINKMKIISRIDAENYRELVNICETTRGHLDGALNRMHLAKKHMKN